MDQVFQKTRELAEAIAECETFQRMKDLEETALQNTAAAELLKTYTAKRMELQGMMLKENPDPIAMRRLSDEMDEAQEQLNMVDDIAALNEARSAFSDLIGQINQVLQFMLTGRMEQDEEGCTGSCATCGGRCMPS